MAEQRFGAGGVPYVGNIGEHGDSPAASESPAEQPAPEVKVEVTETETPGDIPKG